MAEDEQNSTVNTTSDEKQNRQENEQKKQNKPRFNIINFIVKHFSIIWKVALVIFFILFIIGIIQILITMPGLILGKLKEFAANFLSATGGWFTGDNISAKISKEDEISIAQYIQDMGYDVLGYGFGEATYDDSEEGDTGLENSTIKSFGRGFVEGIGDGVTGKTVTNDYVKAYMVQNEATYTLSAWSWNGLFKSIFEGGTAEEYSKGMIHVTKDGKEIAFNLPGSGLELIKQIIDSTRVTIDRDRKLLRVRVAGEGFLSSAYFYFNMANWTSRYGKPLELFLALHLSSMMPDLAYDLATAECFNTKVNIDLQSVSATYTVTYKPENGDVVQQDEIEKIYLNARWGISSNYTGQDFEKFVAYVIAYSKSSKYDPSKGIDLTYIEYLMNGKEPKDADNDYEEVPSTDENGVPKLDKDGKQIMQKKKVVHKFSGQEKEQSSWEPIINNSKLAGIDAKELQGFMDLIEEGRTPQIIFWPRIKDVVNHWYYNKITYTYGRAGTASKRIKYEPEDENNALYNISGITLNAILASNAGVYYQLCEPEAEGPNEAIIALFKGGSGSLNDIPFDFEGKYYRYDGTRDTARRILNAKSENNGYIFGGKSYDKEAVSVVKEPVSFYDIGEDGKPKNSYKNAYSAFAILERANSEEAEACYRNLKELLVYLEYFTEDELKDPLYQVLDWLMPGNLDEKNLTKDANKYGIIVKNSAGQNIIAPGNAKVISVEDNSVTIKFTKVDAEKMAALTQKYINEFYTIDENSVLDYEMVISGITPSVSNGQDINRGSSIGTASADEVQVYMKYWDGSIIDDVTKYMNQKNAEDVDDEDVRKHDNFGESNNIG